MRNVRIIRIKRTAKQPKTQEDDMTTKKEITETPTLAILNETDDPARFGGERLGADGQGNELWLFSSVDKVANRYQDDEGNVFWEDDIEGWNYTDEYALD